MPNSRRNARLKLDPSAKHSIGDFADRKLFETSLSIENFPRPPALDEMNHATFLQQTV